LKYLNHNLLTLHAALAFTTKCLCVFLSITIADAHADPDPARLSSAGISAMHYATNDKNRSSGFDADLEVPVTSYDLLAKAMVRYADDPQGQVNMESFLAGARHNISKNINIGLGAGAAIFKNIEYPTFMTNLKFNNNLFKTQTMIERSPLYQTAAIIRNEIMFYGMDSKLGVHIADRFEPKAEASLRSYSDNNASYRIRGDLPIKLLSEPVKITIGYRQEHTAFRRQSGSGYFDPSSLTSYQGVMTLSGAIKLFSFHAEIFGGTQHVDRYGAFTKNGFAGVYTYARVDGVGPFAIIVDAEASDYALSSVSGFSYMQGSLRVETSW